MAAKAKKSPEPKIKTKAQTNGEEVVDSTGPKPAPKDGPSLTLRARNVTQIERIKRAASKAGISMNTWAVEVLDRAAQAAGVSR